MKLRVLRLSLGIQTLGALLSFNTVAQTQSVLTHTAEYYDDSARQERLARLPPYLNVSTNRDPKNLTPFQAAVLQGHFATAASLVDQGADVNVRDPYGNTLLHLVLLQEIREVTDLPPTNWFSRIVRDPDHKTLDEYLIRPPLDLTNYDLMRHGWFRNTLPQAVCFLLACGIDVNATNATGQTALELLLERRVHPDVFLSIGENPIIAHLLVDHGADVNRRDANGETVLHRYDQMTDVDQVALVISLGADINATNYLGETPLHKLARHLTCWSGNEGGTPFQLLVKAKANVNIKDNHGATPLRIVVAADHGMQREAEQLLRDAGGHY